MATNKLTAVKIERTKKPGMYADGDGLYLRVARNASGSITKNWVYRYMLDRKPHWMGLGPFPLYGLMEARGKAVDARKLRHEGMDPIAQRRSVRASRRLEEAKGITFRQCAEAYTKAHRAGWRHPKHVEQWEASLENYAHPVIGDLPVGAIDTALMMKVLEPHWAEKTETMSRVRQRIESILAWATVRGYRAGQNPAQWRHHLDKLLPAKSKMKQRLHFTALAYADMPEFMGRLRAKSEVAARALEFLILTAVRLSDLVGSVREDRTPMLWEHVAGNTWIIPATKNDREHRVPLSDRALEILAQIGGRGTGAVFPGVNQYNLRYMLNRRMSTAATMHGFRSSFRDWAGDCTAFDRETIEFALAHGITDATEAAYRRGTAIEKRRKLMQAWADYCDSRTSGAENVVPIRRSISGE
jgi:integrase